MGNKSVGIVFKLQDKCSAHIKKISEQLKISEKDAKKLQMQFSQLHKTMSSGMKKACSVATMAVGAMAVATSKLIIDTTEAGDRIDKMSQKIGVSRKYFQEMDYVMSQNGGSVESLQMGFKAMSNQLDGVSKGSKDSLRYFSLLGVSVKNNNGKFRSQEDIFKDTVSSLQKMKNQTQKTIIANKLFGRSANDLKPLLNQTAEGTQALTDKANKLGMVMSDKAVDDSIKFKDTMDTLQRSMSGFGFSIGAELLPQVQQVADELVENLPQIKSTLLPIFNTLGSTLSFVIKHFEELRNISIFCLSTFVAFKIITTISIAMTALAKATAGATTAQEIFIAVSNLNPAFLLATVIGAVITSLVIWEQKTHKLTLAFKAANAMIKIFVDWCKKIPSNIKTNIQTRIDTEQAKKSDKLPKYASGTSFASGGLSLVGEQGPELVNVPKGSQVYNAGDTQKAIGGKNAVVNINIAGNVIGNGAFIHQLKQVLGRELAVALAK